MTLEDRMGDLQGVVREGTPADGVRLTGRQIFQAKSQSEQDEMLGPEAANAVRSGLIQLDDLKGESELAEGENFITQKPLSDLIKPSTQSR